MKKTEWIDLLNDFWKILSDDIRLLLMKKY